MKIISDKKDGIKFRDLENQIYVILKKKENMHQTYRRLPEKDNIKSTTKKKRPSTMRNITRPIQKKSLSIMLTTTRLT